MATTIESVLNDMKRLLSALLLREQRKEQERENEEDADSVDDEASGKEKDEKAKKKQDDNLAKEAEKNLRDKDKSDRRFAEDEKAFLGDQRRRYDQIGNSFSSFLVGAAQSLIPPQFKQVVSDVAMVGSGIVRLGHAAIQEEQAETGGHETAPVKTMQQFVHTAPVKTMQQFGHAAIQEEQAETGGHETAPVKTMQQFVHTTTKNVTSNTTSMQPRGTDTVPAMLTPGEFVVNEKAAKENAPLLSQMNSGGMAAYAAGGPVRYLAGGGNASTSTAAIGNAVKEGLEIGAEIGAEALGVPPEVADAAIEGVIEGFLILKGVLIDLPVALYNWSHSLLESQRRLAEFSPAIAQATYYYDVQERVRNYRLGEATGESTQALSNSLNTLENTLLPIRAAITNIENYIGVGLVESMNLVIEVLKIQFPLVTALLQSMVPKGNAPGSETWMRDDVLPNALLDLQRRQPAFQDPGFGGG